MIVCVHGKQMVPEGEKGVYFICQLKEAYLGNHCRYVRWCPNEKHYEATVDKSGNMCKFFSTVKPETKKLVAKVEKKPEVQASLKRNSANKTAISFEVKAEASKDLDEILEEKNKAK